MEYEVKLKAFKSSNVFDYYIGFIVKNQASLFPNGWSLIVCRVESKEDSDQAYYCEKQKYRGKLNL